MLLIKFNFYRVQETMTYVGQIINMCLNLRLVDFIHYKDLNFCFVCIIFYVLTENWNWNWRKWENECQSYNKIVSSIELFLCGTMFTSLIWIYVVGMLKNIIFFCYSVKTNLKGKLYTSGSITLLNGISNGVNKKMIIQKWE